MKLLLTSVVAGGGHSRYSLCCLRWTTHKRTDINNVASIFLSIVDNNASNSSWPLSNCYLKILGLCMCMFSCSLLALLASTVHWLHCFLFLNAANSRLRSVLDSVKLVRCGEPAALSYSSPLSRSAILPCPPLLSLVPRPHPRGEGLVTSGWFLGLY